MTEMPNPGFVERYGQWALIVGASDGLGAELAKEAARRGLNCALVARRGDRLEQLASDLRCDHGIDTLCRSIDLTDADAADRLDRIADAVDVGLLIINTGGDTVASAFLDGTLERWQGLIGRNIGLLTETLHRFGRRLAARGSGGLVVVGSDSAFNGAGRLSIYSASKAYALNLMESLWAELRHRNVDAAYLVIGTTDTPKMRAIIEARGGASDAITLADPIDIARWALDGLRDGPTLVYDAPSDSTDALSAPEARRRRVERNTRIIDFFYGDSVGTIAEDLKSGRSWK